MAKRGRGKPKPTARGRAARGTLRHAPQRPGTAAPAALPRENPVPRGPSPGSSTVVGMPLTDYSYVTRDIFRIGLLAALLLGGMVLFSLMVR